MAVTDTVLEEVSKASMLRTLSCAACYSISDRGLQCLSRCSRLQHLNINYCHLVSDTGIALLAAGGTLQRLLVRALPNVTDKSVAELSKHCTDLMELDLSGCWQISNKSLYALQENLVHMRGESPSSFHLTVGGTAIDGESAVQFAAHTNSNVSLHNLSIVSLQEDHSFLEPVADYEEDEFVGDECGDTSTAKAYDWLEADDPALFSDEFSEPEFDCH